MQNFYLILAGGLGALAKDCVQDNKLQLPFLKDGYFDLGFLSAVFAGAFVGFVVDHDPLSAALGGYVGISILDNILPHRKDPLNPPQTPSST